MFARVREYIALWLATALLAVLPTSCSTIDDDLSGCPPETDNYQLDYELRLVTNISTELQTELTTQTEVNVANALRNYLRDIFTDYAHDVELSFYDTQGDSLRLHHDEHVMDANQASYALNLPMRQYMHLAAANLVDNPVVNLVRDERCHQSQLSQVVGDTIPSHTTGLFTARLPMEVLEGIDQHFNVRLYMANCAASLVVDTIGSGIRSMRVFTTGFATSYSIADSSYTFADRAPVVRAGVVEANTPGLQTFCSVNFPSHDVQPTRLVIEAADLFEAATAETSLWQIQVFADLADGTTTKSVLYLASSLKAGQLRVIKAKAHQDGGIRTADPTVGVSVTTKWNKGGTYNPEF